MKKVILLTAIVVYSFSPSQGQTADDVFSAQKFTWYGLDYTNTYFISSLDFPDPDVLKSKIGAWNKLIFDEADKYNLAKFFKKGFTTTTKMLVARNEEIDITSRISDDGFLSTHLGSADIHQIINSYETADDHPGIGLVFIVESYNKPNGKGAYWVTFFDIETRKILITERMLGSTGGIGLRNYWAKSYLNVMIEAGKEFGN